MKKLIAVILSVSFLFEQTGFAQIAGPGLPVYFSPPASLLSEKFRPMHLRYLNYIP